jgi:succinyl-CoA--D-citramalate CoA-transferase
MGGIRYINGFPDAPPPRIGLSLGDSLAATFGAFGALAALYRRDARGGQGQMVDVGIYEAVLALMESTIPEYALTGHVRGRSGSILPGIAPSNIYPTSEGGYVVIGANADTVFRRFSEAVGHPEWSEDERYATHNARGEYQEELDEMISEWSREHTGEEVLEAMREAGVPASKVYTAEDMMNDPHYAARENIVNPEDPEIGPVPMQNVVPRLSETPGEIRHTGPALGQHNDEIYGGILKLDAGQRGLLREKGVI